jgi:hypothetical protein
VKAAGMLGAILLALGLLLAACGGAASLPDQGACPTPAASDTDDSSPAAYQTAVFQGLGIVGSLHDSFTAAWPERRIREDSRFRGDWAEFSHLAICALEVVRDLEGPGDFGEFDGRLTDFTERYIENMEQGADAVAARNNSEYNRWLRDNDNLRIEANNLSFELGQM